MDQPTPAPSRDLVINIQQFCEGLGEWILFNGLDADALNWSQSAGAGTLVFSDDATSPFQGKHSLKIVESAAAAATAHRDVDDARKDWSQFAFHYVWLKTLTAGNVTLRIQSTPGNNREYTIVINNDGAWHDYAITLDAPGAINGTLDLQNVTTYELVVQANGTYNVDIPILAAKMSVIGALLQFIANPSGRVLAQDKSIENALGHDGNVEYDEGLHEVLGVDTANNNYDSGLVTDNDDGSILERLEGVLFKLGVVWLSKATANGTTTTLIDTAAGAAFANDYFNQLQLTILTGTNAGVTREVVDFDKVTSTFTFEEPLLTFPGTDARYCIRPVKSCEDKIGANNNNNIWASGSVVDNDDGTVLERLEGILLKIGVVWSSVTDGAGGVSSLVDSTAGVKGDDYFNDLELVILTGADAGLTRNIVDFVAGTGTFHLTPPLPAAPGIGARYMVMPKMSVASELVHKTILNLTKAGGTPTTDSFADQLYIGAGEQLRTFIAKTGATPVPATKGLYNIAGTQYTDSGAGNVDTQNIGEHLSAGVLNGTGTSLPANKSIRDVVGTQYTDSGAGNIDTQNVGEHLSAGLINGTGTPLVLNKALYDLIGAGYAMAAGGDTIDTLRTHLMAGLMRTGGTALGAGLALYDILGPGFVGAAGATPDLKSVQSSQASWLGNGAGAALAAGKSLYNIMGTGFVNGATPDIDSIQASLSAWLGKGAGTALPASKSLYDISGVGYVAGAGGATIDSIRTHLLNGMMQTGGTALPGSKSLYDESGGFLANANLLGGLKGSLGIPDVVGGTLYSKIIGTPLSGVIDNLNVNTEQDLIPEVAITTVTRIDAIYVDFTAWLLDASIAASGATLTIRVYVDDAGGTLREVGNLRDIITEAVTPGTMVQVGGLGTIERNYKVTVQSSIAPTGGAASNLVKYHYSTYDKE